MIKSYSIDVRKKMSERDLTIELYGCNLECRFCCSALGKRLPPKYIGVEQILKRTRHLLHTKDPHMIRFTGGEFSIHGKEAIELYVALARLNPIKILIETNLTLPEFWIDFKNSLMNEKIRSPIFIISVKDYDHVISGHYDTAQIVNRIRQMFSLFPETHFAIGFIGFHQGFKDVLFRYFPELTEKEEHISLEKEGRFKFEALNLSLESPSVYYFEQKVKKYRVKQKG